MSNSACHIPAVDLRNLIFRRGTIVEGCPILDLATARAAGAAILKNTTALSDVLSMMLRREGFNPQEAPEERAVMEPGQTVIISLPQAIGSRGELALKARACITVCSTERRAKIWSRYILTDKYCRGFDPKAASCLRREFERVSMAIHRKMLRAYEQQFRSNDVASHGPSWDSFGEIFILGADCSDPHLIRLKDRTLVFDLVELGRDPEGNQIKDRLHALGGRENDSEDYFDLRTSDGCWGVFHRIVDERSAVFTGLCVPPRLPESQAPTGAHKLTRTLASFYGAAF